MDSPNDAEAVVNDSADDSGAYGWLINHLAKFPGRVTLVTFAAGAVVTAGVLLVDGDFGIAEIVSLVATLWALFFAVMIYLLTARDTDKVLDQISDLREQLATALDAPAPSDAVIAHPAAAPTEQSSADRGSVAPAHPTMPEQPATKPDQPIAAPTKEPGRSSRERTLSTDRVPADFIDAWQQATGLDPATIHTAWTRDPRATTHWVFETDENGRWLVFKRGNHGIGVMSLDRRPDHRSREVRWQPGRGDGRQPRDRRAAPRPRPRGQ